MTDYAHGKKLDRLENTVVALKGEVQRLEDAHAELAATVSALTAVCASHFAALETPATPAPDPVCQCGHGKDNHWFGDATCCSVGDCDCQEYEPISTAEPEPAPLDRDEGMRTLPEKTAAQERYHEANERHYSNREVEMAAGAFDRAEEVAQELDDWTYLIHMRLNTMSQRIAALDPAPGFTDEQDSAIRHALAYLREAGNDRETRGLSTDRIDQSCNVLVAMLGRDGAR